MKNSLQLVLPLDAPARRSAPLRRRVYRVFLEPDSTGTYRFKARSFTRRKGKVYRCSVNPGTGRVWCSCRDFQFRKAHLSPTMESGPLCKHLARAVRTVRKVERHQHGLAEGGLALAA